MTTDKKIAQIQIIEDETRFQAEPRNRGPTAIVCAEHAKCAACIKFVASVAVSAAIVEYRGMRAPVYNAIPLETHALRCRMHKGIRDPRNGCC